MPSTKICTLCGKKKRASSFNLRRPAPVKPDSDKRMPHCKKCARLYSTEWKRGAKLRKPKNYDPYEALLARLREVHPLVRREQEQQKAA